MGGQSDETERTIVFADIALSQIRALGHSAEPRNYEIWYHYATGYNPALNKTINETIERKGRLDAADLDAIRERFVGANRLNQEIEQFGNKVADEIEQIMGMVGTAVGSATSYSETLADASVEIGNATDGDGLRVIVEGLIKTTKEIESANNSLEERLKASHQEIQDLRESLEVVRHESLTDPLTALSNRKYFDQSLSRMSMRDNAPPMSLLMIDVDHFKAFNDTFGHLTGDQVLRLVAQCIKQNVKG